MIEQNRALFDQIEDEYGVPAPVLVAFWAMETDFQLSVPMYPVLRSMTTLAYDCRRAGNFRENLMSALLLMERGDFTTATAGSWAGEVSGLQFTPTDYLRFSVSESGHRLPDLTHSAADTMATGAKFLKSLGWKPNQPWLIEVRAPAKMPWQEADITLMHSQAEWKNWGVTAVDGKPLPDSNLHSSLLLPMGRLGPAFLAYPNFTAYLGWNSAIVYTTSAAYLATRLDKVPAPVMRKGNGPVDVLTTAQVKELQEGLKRAGFDIKIVDGKMGSGTRTAVKAMQLKLGLPADSYPTPELLEMMN